MMEAFKALRREIDEEISADLLDWGVVAWERFWWHDKPNEIAFNARAWAKVKLNDWTPDPDAKAIKRKVFTFAEAKENLGYGPTGDFILDMAVGKYNCSRGISFISFFNLC